MARWTRPVTILLVTLAVLFAGCGDDDDDTASEDTASEDTATEDGAGDGGSTETSRDDALDADQIIEDFEYVLQPVQADTEISFVNLDQAPHTLTAEDGSFDSGTVEGNQSVTFDAPPPGEYDVFCEIHPDITGTLVVEE